MFNTNSLIQSLRTIKPANLERITDTLLQENGSLKIVESEKLATFSRDEIANFCHQYGFYSLPTLELLDFIRGHIDNLEKTIEIGAGNGIYGRELGITATDSMMQNPKNARKFPGVQDYYSAFGQPVVNYGENVIEIDGQEAVRKYKAETVFCSWVTHKYRANRHELGGNMYGVDFKWILDRKHTKRVILVGNKRTHANNPIMDIKHQEIELPGVLFSRAQFPELDRVFIWDC